MGIILRWKKLNYMLEIDISRNDPQEYLGVLRSDFWEFGCWKDTQTPSWLRLCSTMQLKKSVKHAAFTNAYFHPISILLKKYHHKDDTFLVGLRRFEIKAYPGHVKLTVRQVKTVNSIFTSLFTCLVEAGICRSVLSPVYHELFLLPYFWCLWKKIGDN